MYLTCRLLAENVLIIVIVLIGKELRLARLIHYCSVIAIIRYILVFRLMMMRLIRLRRYHSMLLHLSCSGSSMIIRHLVVVIRFYRGLHGRKISFLLLMLRRSLLNFTLVDLDRLLLR